MHVDVSGSAPWVDRDLICPCVPLHTILAVSEASPCLLLTQRLGLPDPDHSRPDWKVDWSGHISASRRAAGAQDAQGPHPVSS